MNILFVIDSLSFGGAERQLVELVKGLSRYTSPKIRIFVACLKEDKNSYVDVIKDLGIEVFYVPRKYKLDLFPIFKLMTIIKSNQVSIVHSYNNIGALFGAIAAKLCRKPLVCSAIRDAKDWNLFSKYSKKYLSMISDIFISNSVSGFRNRFKVIKPHFHIIYNGIDKNRFVRDFNNVEKLKEDLKLKSFKYCIGMVAALSKRKDHKTFILAANNVIKRIPDACFLVIGDGETKPKIEDMVLKLNLQNNFRFLGYRHDCDKLTSVLDISVLLTNTEYHFEGISNAIIEAMAFGIPVIATKGGGTEELIRNNINGFLVNPKNSYEVSENILQLIDDKFKYRKISNQGKKTINLFCDLEKYTYRHLNIYKSLLLIK